MAQRVGFVGVGRMGAPMVRRFLAHGYEVFLRDVSDAAVRPFKLGFVFSRGTRPRVEMRLRSLSSSLKKRWRRGGTTQNTLRPSAVDARSYKPTFSI